MGRCSRSSFRPRCSECGEVIPPETGGGLTNLWHLPSCSPYDPDQDKTAVSPVGGVSRSPLSDTRNLCHLEVSARYIWM